MINLLTDGLKGSPGWRGWWFWQVTTVGGHDPARVATSWSVPQVVDAAIGLMIKGILEGL